MLRTGPKAQAQVRARSDPDAATTPCRTQMWRFPVHGGAGPQSPHKGRNTTQVCVNHNLAIHHCAHFRFFTLRQPDALRQTLILQGNSNQIMPGIRKVGQSVRHPKNKQNGRVRSSRGARIPFFNPAERHAADERTLRQKRGWNPTAAAHITQIRAELPQRTHHWQRSIPL